MNFCLNITLLIVLLSIGYSSAEQATFDNYRLIRLHPTQNEHVELIETWENNPDFDVWNSIKGLNHYIDVLLSPSSFLVYEPLFKIHRFRYEILDNNIQTKIDEQARSMLVQSRENLKSIVGTYARYSAIQTFLKEIVSNNTNPKLVAHTKIAGKTLGLRDLTVLTLTSTDGLPAADKRKIWIDCGIHAREWLSPSTCIYIIDKLVSEFNKPDPTVVALLTHYEIHILPLVNPDGYEYSMTTYRLWRKNRKVNAGNTCYGVDLNRNCGYGWMHSGASTNPCSDTYAGPSADSEPETRAVEGAIMAHLGKWDSFLTIHTYGQWWLTSWGYNTSVPLDFDEMVEKGKIGAAALKAVHGTTYVVGSSARLLYDNSGSSQDWAKGTAQIKYSYTLELRPGQGSPDAPLGFVVPVDRAIPTGEETYAGIKAFLVEISK